MGAKQLVDQYRIWSNSQQPLVLASVYETQGSTYSKIGAQMLITGDGVFQGMLSGGCLEGDLAERAAQVAENGLTQAVTYDLSMDDDGLWGLGVGCDGVMRVLLQRLDADESYQPFSGMVDAFEGARTHVAATVVESEVTDLEAGASMLWAENGTVWTNIAEEHQHVIKSLAQLALQDDHSIFETFAISDKHCRVLLTVLRPYPRLLVLGAGLDAEPLVNFAEELGWRVTVVDHRQAYIDKGNFARAFDVICAPVERLAETIDLTSFDAAVVMSHHLQSDELYLRHLAQTNIPYLGLLGPLNRRTRILRTMGEAGDLINERLHGPAGINIGASGPASIALSIVAQIQAQQIRQ